MMMMKTAALAAIVLALTTVHPIFAQTSDDTMRQEEQRRKVELARKKADEMKARQADAARTAEAMRRRSEEVMRAAEEMIRRTEEQMIQPWAVPWEADKDFDKVRVLFDMANAQHAITMMMIEDGRYDDAVKETSKILSLGFPDRYDLFMLNEVDEIASELEQRSADDAAIKVLVVGESSLHHPEAKAGCLMQVAKIHRKNNRKDLAIKAYREAIALNEQAIKQKSAAQKK